MNKLGMVLVACALATVSHRSWADESQTCEVLRVILELSDGSRVIGAPAIESVPVQTAYAKMAIPLKQILTIRMGDDRETAEIEMRNGDKIKGVVTLPPVALDTVLGTVTIGVEHIRRCLVNRASDALPEDLRRCLTLYYSFDGDDEGRVKDMSGKGHDGVRRGAKWIPGGSTGGACEFREDDSFVDAGTPPAQAGSLSVSAWIRTTQTVADQRWIVTRSAWQNGAWQLMTCNGRGAAEFDPGGMFTGNRAVADGNWHNLVAVYEDGSRERRLYVDGELDATDKGRGKFTENANAVYVGKRPDVPHCFKGSIDEVMIFNRALTAAEVRQVYGAGGGKKGP